MGNGLVPYDHILKPKDISFELCDTFYEGVYIPKDSQIILCANALIRKEDFENAITRMLIKLYDHKRSDNYSFDNCKHLACSEVRAAQFHTECNPKERR
jgi:inner membrane protease ATP23